MNILHAPFTICYTPGTICYTPYTILDLPLLYLVYAFTMYYMYYRRLHLAPAGRVGPQLALRAGRSRRRRFVMVL